MNNEFDKRLQDLLKNHTEQPSSDCWDKISSRLDSMQTPDVNSSMSSANNISTFSQFAGSIAGKIAITAAVVASAGTIIYFAVRDNNETSQQLVQQQELPVKNQDTVLLSENYSEEVDSVKDEKTFFSDKFVQDADTKTIDAIIEKEKEENTTALLPIAVQPTVKSESAVVTKEEASPQKETPQDNLQLAKQETVKEFMEEEMMFEEEKEEPDRPKQPKLIIPNIITPNGDDINDFFVLTNIEQTEENQLDIFTKDGKVIYSKRFYDNSWDGNGLPNGVYYYIFRFTYEENQFMRKGSITIKR